MTTAQRMRLANRTESVMGIEAKGSHAFVFKGLGINAGLLLGSCLNECRLEADYRDLAIEHQWLLPL